MILHSWNQVMGEKTQRLSYSKSKSTAVGAGRRWVLGSTNGERRK